MRTRARHVTKADETDEFKAFWAIWQPVMNKNDGRGSARDEFFRHVEEYGVDPHDIVDGARWFVRSGGNKGEYKLHAQTWLNRMAYEDGCEKEREYQRRLAEREQAPQVSQSPNVVAMKRPETDNEARRRHAEEILARSGFGPRTNTGA